MSATLQRFAIALAVAFTGTLIANMFMQPHLPSLIWGYGIGALVVILGDLVS